MYTKEQLQAMSNHSINALLAYLATGVDYTIYENQVKLLSGDASMDYCNNPNDIMPLAFEHKISLVFNCVYCEPIMWEAVKGAYLGIHDGEFLYDMAYPDENPLRAIACCLILVLQERDK